MKPQVNHKDEIKKLFRCCQRNRQSAELILEQMKAFQARKMAEFWELLEVIGAVSPGLQDRIAKDYRNRFCRASGLIKALCEGGSDNVPCSQDN